MAFKGGGKGLGLAGKFDHEDRSRDWYCSQCSERNFLRRGECHKCGASKPKDGGALPPGPASGTILKGMIKSYNRKGFGFIMGLDGSPLTQDIYYSRESLHPSLQVRDIPGEHITFEIHRFSDGKCLAKNIKPVGQAAEIFTNGKGSDRQVPPPIRSEFKGKGKGGGVDEDRSRDWKCEQCGERNFEKRFECFKCKAPKKVRNADEIDTRMRRISPHAGSRAFAQTLGGRAPCSRSRSRSRSGRRRNRKKSSSSESNRKSKAKRGKSSSSSSSSSSRSSHKNAGGSGSGAQAVDADEDASGSKPATSAAEKAKAESLQKLMELQKVEPPQARLKQYRELLRRWHPDKNPDNVEVATVVFQFLQKGRALLGT